MLLYRVVFPVSRFSDRMGMTKLRTEFQLKDMDSELRNCLWNEFYAHYFQSHDNINIGMITLLWNSYFKIPIDTIQGNRRDLAALRQQYFGIPWYEVYNFIEFVADKYDDAAVNQKFIEACNQVLEREKSGFRFVGKQVTPITDEKEVAEIEEALASPFKAVSTHLENALKLMSDKKSPDFPNSIKESISSVEAMCRIICGENLTLGRALDKIEKEGKIELHGALKEAFDKLYGYASSAEGIRHAHGLLEGKSNLSLEDAKFMLISCSAFVNYLMVKASKAGLKIG
jgi:hypothetical protein